MSEDQTKVATMRRRLRIRRMALPGIRREIVQIRGRTRCTIR
jgi:hypothetical protein